MTFLRGNRSLMSPLCPSILSVPCMYPAVILALRATLYPVAGHCYAVGPLTALPFTALLACPPPWLRASGRTPHRGIATFETREGNYTCICVWTCRRLGH